MQDHMECVQTYKDSDLDLQTVIILSELGNRCYGTCSILNGSQSVCDGTCSLCNDKCSAVHVTATTAM